MTSLTFEHLRQANLRRAPCLLDASHENRHSTGWLDLDQRGRPACKPDWSLLDWCASLGADIGHMQFLAHEVLQGANDLDDSRDLLQAALADIVIGADLLASLLGDSLGSIVERRFNEVSAQQGLSMWLPSKAAVECGGG